MINLDNYKAIASKCSICLCNPERNIAVLASAGTGKTYSLISRLIALLYKGVKYEEILVITFSNSAICDIRRKLKERIENIVKGKDDELLTILDNDKKIATDRVRIIWDDLYKRGFGLNISTVHSFFSSIVGLFPFEIGRLPGYKIIEETEERKFLREIIDMLFEDAEKNIPLQEAIERLYAFHHSTSLNIKEFFLKLMEKLYLREIDIKEKYKQFPSKSYLQALCFSFLSFLNLWGKLKQNKNIVTFHDMEVLVHDFLKDRIDKDYFYFRLDGRVKHLLIDEFQDISVIQWKILEPLVEEITSGMGTKEEKGSLFYVGDTKQSIYRFRGGETGLFHYVERRFEGKIKSISLDRNYRSSKKIVNFVNNLFSHLFDDYISQEVVINEEGYVEVNEFKTREEVINQTVEKAKELINRRQEVAILARTSRMITDICKIFDEQNIPYTAEGKLFLLDTPEIRSIMNALYFLSQQDEYYKHGVCIEKIEPLVSKVNYISLSSLILKIVEQTGELVNDNIAMFLDIVMDYEKENPSLIASFLHYLEKNRERFRIQHPPREGAVKLLTIHGAKGLEFDTVILPETDFNLGLDSRKDKFVFSYDDNFNFRGIYKTPTKREREKLPADLKQIFEEEDEKHIQEELNVLYVALTRAKYELYISGYGKKGITWFNKISKCVDIPFKDGITQKWVKLKEIKEESYYEPLTKKWWGGVEKIDEVFIERESRLFGEMTHAFLEMIDKEDDFKKLDEIEKKIKSRFLFVSDNLWKQTKKTVEEFLNSKIAYFIFSQSGRNELSVCIKDKTYIIDRVVIEKEKITIFDYKTETLNKENIDKYRGKMCTYKDLLSTLYSLPVESFLVFIRDRKMIEV